MELKQLRMDMMKSKKANPERAKVLQAVLGTAQLVTVNYLALQGEASCSLSSERENVDSQTKLA